MARVLPSAFNNSDAWLDAIEAAFIERHGSFMRQELSPDYLAALAALGHPEKKLPPVFHVAGTNGKGSTCAFLRSILEAAGYRVHISISPHLIHVHERIRLAGTLITEDQFLRTLERINAVVPMGQISYFETIIIAAFLLFSEVPADFAIFEVGLGGRLDATNVVDHPLAALITRLSYDHCKFLGSTLPEIAKEKAGIMKPGRPCFVAPQADVPALQTLRDCAAAKGAAIHCAGHDWQVRLRDDGFVYEDAKGVFDLPRPSLLGDHQCVNAGLAIAALRGLSIAQIGIDAIKAGLAHAVWPGRLQNLSDTKLMDLLPKDAELWLDGGHNDSCGEVIAAQLRHWRAEDPARPVHVIMGMLTTKEPAAVVGPLLPYVTSWQTIPMARHNNAFTAGALADALTRTGARNVTPCATFEQALQNITTNMASSASPRVLVFGSLYLAGEILENAGVVLE